MSFILGLAAGLVYGAADFLGGLSAKRAHVIAVVLISEIAGTGVMALFLPLFPGTVSAFASIGWAVVAGLCGGIGVLAFYRGLAKGAMGVVAPLTGVVAATIPVLTGFALGERPATVAVVGIAVALVAVLLISRSSDESSERRTAVGVPEALGAAAGFGGYFVFLSRTNDASGLWPLVWSRSASIVILVPLVLVRRPSLRLRGSLLGTTLGSGLLDVSANVLYLESVRFGLLTLSSVLTSLYPASTVLLARVVLHERLDRVQALGLAFAAAGIVLIALGGT